jgi:major type 1 subunit fimbrin (pilin)
MQPLSSLRIALACLALGVASTASANGVIAFSGNLTDATCAVEGVGKGGSSFTVILPTVSVAELDMPNSTAGTTRFGLQLSGCDPAVNGVRAYFLAGPHLDNTSNSLLPNNGGPVHFALYNADGTRVLIGSEPPQGTTAILADEAMYFDVAYIRARTGAITPGPFEGLVTYALDYL